MEATIVVISAPSKPVSKNVWTLSSYPKIFSSPSLSLIVVTRAMMKKHKVTHICRPTMNPGKLRPPLANRTSQVFLAQSDFPRSSSGILATAKKAICIPSSIPTTAIKPKKKNYSYSRRNTFPHGSLVVEQSRESDRKCKYKNDK